jgi:hypothetical protein
MITLTGREVYSKIVLDSTERSDKNNNIYFIARYGKRGFTLRKDVFDDFKAGNIVELNLEESSYDREDPETGNISSVESLNYAGHLTKQQGLNAIGYEVEVKKMLASALSPEAIINMSKAQVAELDALIG